MEYFSHLISTVRVKFLRRFLSYKHSSEDRTPVHCMKYLPSNGHKVTMGNARNIQWIAPNQSKTGGRFDLQRHGKEHTSNVGMSHGHSVPISHKDRANGHHWVSRCILTNNTVQSGGWIRSRLRLNFHARTEFMFWVSCAFKTQNGW